MASATGFDIDGVGMSKSYLTSWSPDLARGHLIHYLASEILGEIFISCLPYPSNPTSLKDAPLLLLHVCRHWRQTALCTPRLWTDLNLTHRFKLQPARVFQMWLDNSGSLPLKVNLPGYTQDPKQAEDVIELLLDNLHRISELEGSLTASFPSLLLKRTLPIRAPFLTRLSVGGWDKLPSLLDLERLRRCMITPRLEVCLLNSLRFQLSLLTLDPARLRELDGLLIADVAEFESMEILTTFTNLHTLTIVLRPPFKVFSLQIPSIIPIPSLRRLKLAIVPGYDPTVFLRALDVAFIEHLELYSSPFGDYPLGPLLDSLTSGNIPPLKSLALIWYRITASDYMPWIRKFTDLEKLTLERGTLDVEALNSLTCDKSISPALWICPVLSILHLKYMRFPWKVMEDLVQSRAPMVNARGLLRKVTFEGSELLEESHRAAFTAIQESSRDMIQIEFISGQANAAAIKFT